VALAVLALGLGGLPRKGAPETANAARPVRFSPASSRASDLAARVWENEGRSDPNYLLWWNEGEDFASLGIGHFIWYPPGRRGIYRESFPELLGFLAARGVALPKWLAETRPIGCPWTTRAAFMAARTSPKGRALRALLLSTIEQQGEYLMARLDQAERAILVASPPAERATLSELVHRLRESDAGLYALVDYLNFKGSGVDSEERYRGEGWGLMQVLRLTLETPLPDGEAPLLQAFAAAAREVLARRIRNAPPQRREERWRNGWLVRIDSYLAAPRQSTSRGASERR